MPKLTGISFKKSWQHSHTNVNGFIIANDISQKSNFAWFDGVGLRVFTEVVQPQNMLCDVPG